jgi:hypothetical protein
MSLAKALMPSLSHHATGENNDCPDQGIRLDVAAALFGQVEGAGHPGFLTIVHVLNLLKRH